MFVVEYEWEMIEEWVRLIFLNETGRTERISSSSIWGDMRWNENSWVIDGKKDFLVRFEFMLMTEGEQIHSKKTG
jgi:hypothetical protein